MSEHRQQRLSYSALRPFRKSFSAGVPILAFHKLGSLPFGVRIKSLYVEESLFTWQMCDLQRAGFLIESLDSWRDFSRPNRDRAVLTFDDGSRTVLRHALPVLERNRFTAIQFLVADAIGGTNHWDVGTRGEAPDTLMDVAEVRDWLSCGHQIGAHSLTHPRLTAIPEAQAREEVFASKKKLEDLFGVPAPFLLPLRQMVAPCARFGRRSRLQNRGYIGFWRQRRRARPFRPSKDRREAPLVQFS